LKKIQVLHSHYLHHAKLIREPIIDVTKEHVLAKKEYTYDYLVICSGSSYATPIKESNIVIAHRGNELRDYAARCKKASKVLIIGGGVVGVELAGEIIEAYPHKEVIIVHSRSELLTRSSKKAGEYAEDLLKKKGVTIRFNEKIIRQEGNTFFTSNDECLNVDLAFMCVGITPNYHSMKKSCSTSLNERNFVCVNPYLQVQGFDNVFAAGDITNIKEEKTAQGAEKQAEIVRRNICNLEKSRSLEKYVSVSRPMVISIGDNKGMLLWGNYVLTGWLPSLLKKFIEWKTMRRYR